MQADNNIEAGPLPDIDTLEIIADWKDDLRIRYARAQLRYELIGGNGPEIEAMAAEMADFSRVVAILKGLVAQ